MSWIPQSTANEDEAIRAMRLELEKQQQEAEKLLLQKQRKKEQQLLQRQKRRKEQQAIRQEQQQLGIMGSVKEKKTPIPKLKYIKKTVAVSSAKDTSASSKLSDKQINPATFISSSLGGPRSTYPQHHHNTNAVGSGPTTPPIPGPGIGFSGDHSRGEMPLGGGTLDPDAREIDQKRSDSVFDKRSTLLELSRFQCEYASDEDAIETDYYEPLAHGEYFTREEVIRLYRSKLRHLKSMYIHQAQFVKMAYKEKRRLYLAANEELVNSNISYSSDPRRLVPGQGKITPEFISQQTAEQKRAKQLMKYQSFKGSRAAVRMRAKQRYIELLAKDKSRLRKIHVEENKTPKSKQDGLNGIDFSDTESDSESEGAEGVDLFELFKLARESHNKTGVKDLHVLPTQICVWQSEHDTIKCLHSAMPLTKYCYNHILKDERQTLFKACGRPLGNKEDHCQFPVLELIEKLGCPTHRLPVVKEELEPLSKKKERLNAVAKLPTATPEEEVNILEDLIANQTFDLARFDEAVKHIETKGFRAPDTDESAEDDEGEMQLDPPAYATDVESGLPEPEVKLENFDSDLYDSCN